MSRSLILFMLIMCFSGHSLLGTKYSAPLESIVLTSHIDKIIPETEFTCSGKIIAYVTFSKSFEGQHEVESHWFRPDGSIQEHTLLSHHFKPQGSKTAYLWIAFEEEGSLRSFFSREEDSLEKNEFYGDWSFQLAVDGDVISTEQFFVRCPY